MNARLEANIQKIYFMRFFAMFLVLMPVVVPFFQSLGLSMQEVYLLQSVFAVTVFICEVPSGYVSDMLGRKKTLLMATFLKGLGFLLFPIASDITLLIIAEVILGFAVSLSSGTDTSMLYDTMDIVSPEKAQIKVLGRSLYFMSMGEGIAALVASALMFFKFDMQTLAYLSAFFSWIPFFIVMTLVEPPRKKMENNHRENFSYIWRSLFKQSRLLNLILINTVLSFSATLIAVWAFQKYWANIGVPLVYFGLLWAMTNFTVSFFSKRAHKIEK